MLNIPGPAGRTCEGPTRRELMRIGSLGLAGLHLPASFFSQKAALANNVANKYAGARGFGNAKNVIMIFLQGGPSPHRHLGSQAGRARQHSRRIQADQNQNPRHAYRRAHADDGADDGQGRRSSAR